MIGRLRSLGKTQGHASSLDFSSESMRTLKAKVQEIWTDYIAEFPPKQASQELPGATLETHAVSSAEHATEIRATNRIENEHDYQLRVAAWGQACEKAVEEVVDEYMSSTVVLIKVRVRYGSNRAAVE